MTNSKADVKCPWDSNDPSEMNPPLREEATELLCEQASCGEQGPSHKIIPGAVRLWMCSPAAKEHRRTKQPF